MVLVEREVVHPERLKLPSHACPYGRLPDAPLDKRGFESLNTNSNPRWPRSGSIGSSRPPGPQTSKESTSLDNLEVLHEMRGLRLYDPFFTFGHPLLYSSLQ